ncbi:hypothetical protein G5714_018423 [Onychostoma macrolepis]|uniref:Uncharacterized protein n=1 Tax=Onychostoma macrolepis TaxID=369639 RepID=A0A7J6BZ26_9TELE|nr:hypothetical protein G5714_018423 [Onychostoma macrolepis]
MKNKEVWERLKKTAAREGSNHRNLPEKDIDKELFAEEDQVLRRSLVLQRNTASTLHEKMKSEVSPPVLPSEEPAFCCWGKNDTLPRLSQPSST